MNRYVTLEGWAVIDGYEPDGDTFRLVPDALEAVLALPRGRLVAPGADTSVPVRLEGIDAPELHYEGREQPSARPALGALLATIGWPPPTAGSGPAAARGVRVRVRVVTRSCDAHGRIIGYLFAAGARTSVVASVNALLLAAGLVYPLAYDSQPRAHRAKFGELAEAARRARKGVWAHDRSREGFVLRSEASLGPHGALVFPKLFRRSVTFLREASRELGFREWLRGWSETDDAVRIGEGAWRRLSDLLGERGGLVRVERDLTGVTFAGG